MGLLQTSWVEEKSILRRNPANPFLDVQNRALEQFQRSGFPDARDERWRFTDFSGIASGKWSTAPERAVTSARDLQLPSWSGEGMRIVFVDGLFQPQWSRLHSGDGAIELTPFSQLQGDVIDEISRRMSETDQFEDQPFLHLNTALMDEGVLIRIADGVQLEAPVTVLYFHTTGPDKTYHPRNIILMGVQAQAAVIEYYHATSGERYFRNPVTDIALGDESRLRHYVLQRENDSAQHVSFTRSTQGRNSLYTRFAVDFGAAMARHDLVAELEGEGGEAVLNGLYMPQGRQHMDHHTTVRHLQPHTFSRQLYKGVLNDGAHGVFNGRIYVAREAQKTDAIQYNRNLLLSDDAVADTQPQLEIFADDVRCTHGGTIGQLYEDGLFYLRARGIGEETARHIMVHAFAGEVTDRIQEAALRDQVNRWVLERLGWEE